MFLMAVKALSDQDRPLDLTFNEKRSPGLQEKGSKMSTRSHGDRPETGVGVGGQVWPPLPGPGQGLAASVCRHSHAAARPRGGSGARREPQASRAVR